MSDSAEAIQSKMHQVRLGLREDAQQIASSARDAVDWRFYVKHYPWACLGGAALIGFVLVPRRVELVSPDAPTLLQLARRNKLVVKAGPHPQPRNGLASTLLTLVAGAAGRR